MLCKSDKPSIIIIIIINADVKKRNYCGIAIPKYGTVHLTFDVSYQNHGDEGTSCQLAIYGYGYWGCTRSSMGATQCRINVQLGAILEFYRRIIILKISSEFCCISCPVVPGSIPGHSTHSTFFFCQNTPYNGAKLAIFFQIVIDDQSMISTVLHIFLIVFVRHVCVSV